VASWRDSDIEERDFGLNDYFRVGAPDVLEAVQEIVPENKINAFVYRPGGTLSSIAAADLSEKTVFYARPASHDEVGHGESLEDDRSRFE
jgi:poly(3-hydroxyalkanoate) synthetase